MRENQKSGKAEVGQQKREGLQGLLNEMILHRKFFIAAQENTREVWSCKELFSVSFSGKKKKKRVDILTQIFAVATTLLIFRLKMDIFYIPENKES